MKSIEDINKISFDDLEHIADDSSVAAPSGLEKKVEDALLASMMIEQEQAQRKRTLWRKPISYALVPGLVALGLALTVLLQPPEDKLIDTFDNPQLAYAEVEKTLVYISSCINKGLDIASVAAEEFEEPKKTMDRIFKD